MTRKKPPQVGAVPTPSLREGAQRTTKQPRNPKKTGLLRYARNDGKEPHTRHHQRR